MDERQKKEHHRLKKLLSGLLGISSIDATVYQKYGGTLHEGEELVTR